MEMNNVFSKKFILLVIALLAVLVALVSITYASPEGKAEGLEFTTSPDNDSAQLESSDNGGTDSSEVIVNVVPETTVNANEAPAQLKANAIGYTPTYDMTSSDTYANILYDVFLNQGNTFDDFIIFRAGDYRYFLIYGNIDDDLSFSSADVVQLDYNSSWQSGKRYTLTYSSDVSGTFRSNNYTFLTNLSSNYGLSPNVTFERKEQYKTRIAVYILAVMTLFSTFRFFRKSTVKGG